MTHNKKLNPLLNLIINCMSAKTAPLILSIKGECAFLLSNFLIIGLFNSSDNFILGIFSFLITLPEVVFFLSKHF